LDERRALLNQDRRRALARGAGLAALVVVRPARAAPDELAAAIGAWTGGVEPLPGAVSIDIATLVENGNAVPVTVSAASTGDGPARVVAIALFNERNPERDVVRVRFGPRAARASLATRIRLATSQKLVAVAQLADGTFRSQSVDVVVTLAACIEGDP
jgi:sulfur-oxidizing protein SoxY